MRVVDGLKFWRAAKTDATLIRLLSGQFENALQARRAASASSVFDTLQKLRNAETMKKTSPEDEADANKESIGVNANDEHRSAPKRKHRRVQTSIVDIETSIVDIDAPTIADVPCQKLKVLSGNQSECVWVELTPESVNYVVSAIVAEADRPEPPQRKDKACNNNIVTLEKRRGAYRVRNKAEGTQKYIPLGKNAEQALQVARSWVASDELVPIEDNSDQP